MVYRIWMLVLKEFIQLWRDKWLLLFIILGPVTELVAVAWATSGEIRHIPTAVVDYDRSAESRALLRALENTGTFDLVLHPHDQDEAFRLVEDGSAVACLIIPPDFSEKFAAPAGSSPSLQLILDGSEPRAVAAAQAAAEGAIRQYSAAKAFNFKLPVDLKVRIWFNQGLKESNYEVPSELGFMLVAVALMVASLGIAREREMGTLEQLMVTPLSNAEFIAAKAVPAILIAYLDFILMLFLVILVFGIPMRGSWPLLLSVAFFYLLVEIGWGLMISAFSQTQWQALLSVFMLAMVEVVFSGYAFPVENMPWLLRHIANLVPIKHWLIILRGILLKGAGADVFWRELIALAGLGVAINAVTIAVLRRKLE